jgi:hypothetical protein
VYKINNFFPQSRLVGLASKANPAGPSIEIPFCRLLLLPLLPWLLYSATAWGALNIVRNISQNAERQEAEIKTPGKQLFNACGRPLHSSERQWLHSHCGVSYLVPSQCWIWVDNCALEKALLPSIYVSFVRTDCQIRSRTNSGRLTELNQSHSNPWKNMWE